MLASLAPLDRRGTNTTVADDGLPSQAGSLLWGRDQASHGFSSVRILQPPDKDLSALWVDALPPEDDH